MSRHEGVSCDSCMKANFRGKRYKCLICYDYDLCATCYDAGTTTTRHLSTHAMQCILTRTDFDLYYGGETLTAEQPQAFTCPYCGKMGYNETTLQEHVTVEHADASTEVVCPICAALPGGDPNHVTDDFAAHLALEHRGPREFQDEPLAGIRHVRRIPHASRGMGATRARRTFNFQSSSGLSGLSPSTRDTPMDPIAELLSQLSSVRSRAAQSVSSQLQQLEMQLQSTSAANGSILIPSFSSRQQLERLPRQRAEPGPKSSSVTQQQATTILDFSSATSSTSTGSSNSNSQFLLARLGEGELTELERQTVETERADRSLFVQELLLSTLAEGLRLEEPDAACPAVESTPAAADCSGNVVSDAADQLCSSSTSPSSSSAAPVHAEHVMRISPSREAGAAQLANGTAACHSPTWGEANDTGARTPPRPKPTAQQRNMVKHKEGVNKGMEKEPPPANRLARH